PFTSFAVELPVPGPGEPVVLCLAIIVGDSPFRFDIALLLQLEQGGIYRAVVHGEQVSADLFYASRDAISMQRPHRLKSLEYHQRQGPLLNVFLIAHSSSKP